MVGQVRKGTHRWDGHQGEEEFGILEEEENYSYKIRKNYFSENKKLKYHVCKTFSLG